jgi:hypothetical protein
MAVECFFSNGFARQATVRNRRFGMGEIRFYNPTPHDTNIDVTLYYEDRPPRAYPGQFLPARCNRLLLVFPDQNPGFFPDSGVYGMRILSDELLIVDHILAAGVEPPPLTDRPKTTMETWFSAPRYMGGVADHLAVAAPSRLWCFGDGFWIVQDPDKPGFPFNEVEWYHVLNPGAHRADLTMRCFYSDGTRGGHRFSVDGERVLLIENQGLVKPTNTYGLHFESTEPVVVMAERFITGVRSTEEWGMHLHCPRPGVPAPFAVNEAGG